VCKPKLYEVEDMEITERIEIYGKLLDRVSNTVSESIAFLKKDGITIKKSKLVSIFIEMILDEFDFLTEEDLTGYIYGDNKEFIQPNTGTELLNYLLEQSTKNNLTS
jgi:hypothetical protein